jgi:O-antigen ligase
MTFLRRLILTTLLLLPFQLALVPTAGVDLPWIRLAALLIIGTWAMLWLLGRVRLPSLFLVVTVVSILLYTTLSALWSENPDWALRKVLLWWSFLPLSLVFASLFNTTGSEDAKSVASPFWPLVSSLSIFLIYGLFETPLFSVHVLPILMLVVGVLWVGQTRANSPLSSFITALLVGSSIASFIGLVFFGLQFLIGGDAILTILSTTLFPLLFGPEVSGSLTNYPSFWVNVAGTNILRLTSTFPDPHTAGAFFAVLSPLAWYLWQTRKSLWWIVPTLLLPLAALLTFSRSAMVALVVVGVVYGLFFVTPKVRVWLFGIIATLGVSILLLPDNPILARMGSTFDTTDGSNSARLTIWTEAATLWAKSPVFGHGFASYPTLVNPLATYRDPYYAHNLWLDIGTELGIVGILLFSMLFLGWIPRTWPAKKSPTSFPPAPWPLPASLSPFFANASYLLPLLPLTLPLAWYQFKIGSIPLYLPEILLLVVLLVLLLSWFQKYGSKVSLTSLWIRVSLVLTNWQTVHRKYIHLIFPFLFILCATIALLSHDTTLTALGRYKSYFIFPLLALALLTYCRPPVVSLLRAWWYGLCVTSLLGVIWYALGHTTFDGRLTLWYTSGNELALLLWPAPGLTLYLWLRSNSKHYQNTLYGALILVTTVALCLTRSYTGLLAAAFSALLVLWWYRALLPTFQPIQKLIASLGLLVLAALWVGVEGHTAKLSDLIVPSERSSLESRQMIWAATERMLTDNPLTGVGMGNFQNTYLAYQQYFPPYLEWAVNHPHNIFLAFYTELGLFGFLTLLSLIAWLCRLQSSYRLSNPEAALGWALFIGLFIFGLLDTPYFRTDLAYQFWLIYWIIVHKNNPS